MPNEIRVLAASTWADRAKSLGRYAGLNYARNELARLTARFVAGDEDRLARLYAGACMELAARWKRVNDARIARVSR